MTESNSYRDRVHQYLRDELSAEETEAFELELLECQDLQHEVETVMSLRGAVALDAEREAASHADQPTPVDAGSPGWQRLAMAAAVMLAVLSTVMWWKSGNDLDDLERQVQALAAPVGEVLSVPVPIMRSSGSRTPDVIVRKPDNRAAILLDIELGLQSRQADVLDFALVDAEGATVVAWQSSPKADGRATAVIASEQIPAARLWLEISRPGGETLERRLLEFRR